MKTIRFDKDSSLDEIRKYVGQTPTALGDKEDIVPVSRFFTSPLGCLSEGDYDDVVLQEVKGGVYYLCDDWWIEFELLAADPSPDPDSLADRKARLERELAEVNAEIARDGAPEGCLWGSDDEGTSLRSTSCGSHICWETDRSVFVKDTNGEAIDIDDGMLFAWVDRVRANGETDL